jgi:hypothetical protein
VVLLDRRVGDVVGPQGGRQADRDEGEEDDAEGERDAIAAQAPRGEAPGPEARPLGGQVPGLGLLYSPLFRQKRE